MNRFKTIFGSPLISACFVKYIIVRSHCLGLPTLHVNQTSSCLSGLLLAKIRCKSGIMLVVWIYETNPQAKNPAAQTHLRRYYLTLKFNHIIKSFSRYKTTAASYPNTPNRHHTDQKIMSKLLFMSDSLEKAGSHEGKL